uniref:Uncharacterized protein n=1 Tax=Glossina austeni TaxID=7395 RepID=A0A1A9VXA7_GLOAU
MSQLSNGFSGLPELSADPTNLNSSLIRLCSFDLSTLDKPIACKCLGVPTDKAITSPTASWKPGLAAPLKGVGIYKAIKLNMTEIEYFTYRFGEDIITTRRPQAAVVSRKGLLEVLTAVEGLGPVFKIFFSVQICLFAIASLRALSVDSIKSLSIEANVILLVVRKARAAIVSLQAGTLVKNINLKNFSTLTNVSHIQSDNVIYLLKSGMILLTTLLIKGLANSVTSSGICPRLKEIWSSSKCSKSQAIQML